MEDGACPTAATRLKHIQVRMVAIIRMMPTGWVTECRSTWAMAGQDESAWPSKKCVTSSPKSFDSQHNKYPIGEIHEGMSFGQACSLKMKLQVWWCVFKQRILSLSVQFMAPVSLHLLDTGWVLSRSPHNTLDSGPQHKA